MVIKVRCPNGHLLKVKEKHAGRMGACPRCSAPVRVPRPGQIDRDEPLAVPLVFQQRGEKLAPRETGRTWTFTYRHLEVRKGEDLIVVQLVKPRIVDERTVEETVEELFDVASRDNSPVLAVSFSEVVIVLSSILRRLVTLQRKLEAEGRQLRLCNVGNELREVLAATKLGQVLHIEGG